MQLTEQFLITEEGKFELRKIVSVKLTEEEHLRAPVYPLLVLGLLLILFLHPLCSQPSLSCSGGMACCLP